MLDFRAMPHAANAQPTAGSPDVDRVRALLESGEAARALRLLGDRWSFLILRDAFLGVRRFEDLRRLTGAARGTLTARLNMLVDEGILYRSPYAKWPQRFEYRPTEKGLAFHPVALALWAWERRWSDAPELPPRLVHAHCGRKMQPVQICGHCGERIDPRDVGFEIGPGERRYAATYQETRRRASGDKRSEGVDPLMFHAVDTVGDRWSGLVLACLFLGLHRYDDIAAAIGIATNILADRLKRLLAAGVIVQHLYRERPPRYEYRLTPKGLDLHPFTVALHEWASRWLPSPHGPAMRLRHRRCRHVLKARTVCSECGVSLEPRAIAVSGGQEWATARQATGDDHGR